MRESKRKKLHAKGWKIGTPKDFLGMSDEEESYVNLRLGLAEGPWIPAAVTVPAISSPKLRLSIARPQHNPPQKNGPPLKEAARSRQSYLLDRESECGGSSDV
jgi:hypothetical protein